MKALHFGTAVAATIGLLVSSVWVVAQQTDRRQNQLPQEQNQVQQQNQSDQQRPERQQRAQAILKATELTGMEAKTKSGDEDLGSIEDVAINPKEGKIEYVALAMEGDGVLGVSGSDKFVAVPWDKVECREKTEEGTAGFGETTTKVAVIDVDKRTLENAEGFNKDNFPEKAEDLTDRRDTLSEVQRQPRTAQQPQQGRQQQEEEDEEEEQERP